MKSNISCHLSRPLCLFAGGSIDAEKNSISYLYLSKDISPEKEGTTFIYIIFCWKSGSPDTILEGGHPRTIPPMFGCNWPSGF
jgi:hypothetical protein